MIARRMLQLCGMLALAGLLAGCVVTVESLIAESDAIFDARLLGTWDEADGKDRAVVTRGAGNDYVVTYTSDGVPGRFEARLGRLADRLVLDVRPAPSERELPAAYRELLIMGHFALVLDVGATEIRTSMLVVDSLEAALRAGRSPLGRARTAHRLTLYGTTAELRAALATHVRRAGALESPTVFRRVATSGEGR